MGLWRVTLSVHELEPEHCIDVAGEDVQTIRFRLGHVGDGNERVVSKKSCIPLFIFPLQLEYYIRAGSHPTVPRIPIARKDSGKRDVQKEENQKCVNAQKRCSPIPAEKHEKRKNDCTKGGVGFLLSSATTALKTPRVPYAFCSPLNARESVSTRGLSWASHEAALRVLLDAVCSP